MEEAFINRKEEFSTLDKLWARPKAQFIVTYGRRRIGKTALLTHFSSGKKIFYWMAHRSTSQGLLKDLSFKFYSYLNPGQPVRDDFTYGSWSIFFETLVLYTRQKKVGLVIDEFPYLVEAEPSLPSLLQSFWDTKLSKGRLFLVLSGSKVGMIRDEILSPKAPLYGRATGLIHLDPISLHSLHEFYPHFSPVQLVETYGITGGVPKYFEFIEKNKPVLKSVENAIRDKTTFLTAEPEFLLHEEFRETRIYSAILRALGEQSRDLSSLSARCGIPSNNLSKYLDDLVSLKLVERLIPVFLDPDKTRKGLYKIKDLFLDFYFHFIAPFLQEIDQKRFEVVIAEIHKKFPAYIGKNVFEKICQEWVRTEADCGKLHFIPEKVGSFWDKETQIDVVAFNKNDRILLAGECKWTNKEMTNDDMIELEEKIKKLKTKETYTIQLIFFSKSGFSPKARELARKKHYQLVSVEDLFKT